MAGFFSVPFPLCRIPVYEALECLPLSSLFLTLIILPGQLWLAPGIPWEPMDVCPVIYYFLGSQRPAKDRVWKTQMLWTSEGLCHLNGQTPLPPNLTPLKPELQQAPPCVKKR